MTGRESGTARVVFAHWAEDAPGGRGALASEARVKPIGVQGAIGVAAVRPIVRTFHNLVAQRGDSRGRASRRGRLTHSVASSCRVFATIASG